MKKLTGIFLIVTFMLVLSISTGLAAELNQKITAVEVRGNEHISETEILSAVATKAGDSFDRDQLKEEMKTISELGYFQNVKVSLKNYKDGLKIIFEVVENPIIEEINISGNEVYSKATIVEWLRVKQGQVLNVKKMQNGLDEVRKKYQDRGYILAKFTNVNIDKDGILNLEINVGYLNRVILKGNEKTRDFVIMRELDLNEGQVLNINDVKEGYRNLYKLNYFKEINPELKRVEDTENTVNLVVNLEEAKTGQLNFGAGYSSRDGWLGFVKVKEKNLLGRGQTLGFDWQFGDTTDYSLNFYEPWLFGHPYSFGFNVYKRIIDSENADGDEYHEEKKGGSISLGHAITEQWDGTVRYRIEDSKRDWEDDSEYQDEENSINSLTFKVDRNTTNNPFNPTEGAIDKASIEVAGRIFGGDNDFTKYNFDVRRFFPGFKDEHAWALRLKTGIGEGDIPFSDKYRLGGSQSLRGYESYSFEGDEMVLFNAEYRFPIAEKFSGVVFADAGNTWDDFDEIDLGNLNSSLGLGIRFNSPVGQIRLDYGWNEEGDGMPHFSIGNTF